MGILQANDHTRFPDPVYRATVLKPLFDGARLHHAGALRAIDRAHLVMLVETGILDAAQGAAIANALLAMAREIDPAALAYGGDVEDYFFYMERELKARAGTDIGGRLHTARSRNDIDHTFLKLGFKPRIDGMLAACRELLTALIEVARRDRDVLIVAYTHGQPAQPTTHGHYLAAIIEVLIRDMERLEAAREIVDLCPMGAAAITTSGFPIDRHRVAGLLGFSAPLQNSYSCIAATDYLTSVYSAIALIFLHLGRTVQDFQFWSSFEVGQLYLPNAFVQISSIMPQKRNPVPFEHLRHLSSQAVGRSRAVIDVMHNTPFTDMTDSEADTHEMGYQVFDVGHRVLDLLTATIRAGRIDPERVAVNLSRSCATITELADWLVRSEGLSFRLGHEIAADVARGVVAMAGDLPGDGYPVFLKAFEHHVGRKPAADVAEFAKMISPEHFVAVRDRFGGPAPSAMDAALTSYEAVFEGFEARATAFSRHEAEAAAELDQRVLDIARGG
ncbi:argininosuccinate lyase [Bosea sp. PAMC 26642]|uniref:argininosuccinate lyase n=1 Tax=Bosea sp. (strain PAMC 26642) TaxID=1792307 RepID=UPI0007706911|nr:argininosuccinate lyase [Bosea sp. PAMC 26642]AMJ59732.1 argininosuccinate lyase [Bosea sp. PAMC 26642]